MVSTDNAHPRALEAPHHLGPGETCRSRLGQAIAAGVAGVSKPGPRYFNPRIIIWLKLRILIEEKIFYRTYRNIYLLRTVLFSYFCFSLKMTS